MADHETTFAKLQTDERLKKLERCLKLARLRKEHANGTLKVTSWPNVSSINADSTFLSSSPHISTIGSEALASSDNFTSTLLAKVNLRDDKRGMVPASSMKDYNINQRDNHIDRSIMPPPTASTVRCISKNSQKRIYVLSDREKAESTVLGSVRSSTRDTSLKNSSYVSDDRNIDKKYLHSFVAPSSIVDDPQQVDRVFSRWRVTLNDRRELIVRGTLECGKVARSKPVVKRYTATCVESKFKHKYSLRGVIVDERNELPDYIRGKFYNGFPDDWENVYQIWRTYVNQACPVTFRWPSTITDSDDDLRSELTDLTYVRNNATVPTTNRNETSPYKNEYVGPKNLNVKKSPEKIERHRDCSTRTFQNLNDKDCSSAKSFVSDTGENCAIPVAPTKNVKLKEDIKTDPVCRFQRLNTLKHILQEDKLKIIVDNLANENCSLNYIRKLVEMFDCLDYAISYKTEYQHDECAPVVSKCEMLSKSEAIPLRQIVVRDNDHVNVNNRENRTLERKSYTQSTDLGYGSIRNDSNSIQLSDSKTSARSKRSDKKDLDESESEIYAGIPKVSIERLLFKMNQTSGRIHKRKVRKKKIRRTCRTTPRYDAEEVEFESVCTTVPIANSKQTLLPNESCVSITEDETVPVNTPMRQRVIAREPQVRTFSSCRRNNFNICGENDPATLVQNQRLPDSFRSQKVNVFTKQQGVPHKRENFAHSQRIVDCASSNVEAVNTSMNKQKLEIQNKNIKIHAKSDQDVAIDSEGDNDPEKCRELCRGCVEQPQSVIPLDGAKPIVIGSVPKNLNLKISNTESRSGEPFNSDISIIEDEKNEDLISRMKTIRQKSLEKIMKPAITNNNHKSGDIKQDRPKTNNRNDSDNANSANSALRSTINPTTRQSKSDKPTDENGTKILTAWIPIVVRCTDSRSKLGLIFQGKLLNEADYVVNRKFTTGIVLRRLSATLIETVNHEFYRLVGYLNDNKHVLPKELARQCRNGCPVKIEEFCLTWKKLQHGDIRVVEEKFDSTMDSLSVPVSSRGRKILPPLCYWTGERVTLKDNNPVYNPGNSRESLLTSFAENSNKKSEESRKQKANPRNKSKEQDTSKRKVSSESSEDFNVNGYQKGQLFNESSETTVMDRMENPKKSRKSMIIGKGRIKQQLIFLSSDSDEEEKVSSRKYPLWNPNIITADTPSHCTMTLRKRQTKSSKWNLT